MFFVVVQNHRAVDHEQPEPSRACQFTVINGISGAIVE